MQGLSRWLGGKEQLLSNHEDQNSGPSPCVTNWASKTPATSQGKGRETGGHLWGLLTSSPAKKHKFKRASDLKEQTDIERDIWHSLLVSTCLQRCAHQLTCVHTLTQKHINKWRNEWINNLENLKMWHGLASFLTSYSIIFSKNNSGPVW